MPASRDPSIYRSLRNGIDVAEASKKSLRSWPWSLAKLSFSIAALCASLATLSCSPAALTSRLATLSASLATLCRTLATLSVNVASLSPSLAGLTPSIRRAESQPCDAESQPRGAEYQADGAESQPREADSQRRDADLGVCSHMCIERQPAEPCEVLRPVDGRQPRQACWHTMKRTTVKSPDDRDTKPRRESVAAKVTRKAIGSHLGSTAPRRLIAAKAGRSGRHDTARRIEEIIRRDSS